MVTLDFALFDLYFAQSASSLFKLLMMMVNHDDNSSSAGELHGWPDRKILICSSPQCLTKDRNM